MSIALGRTAAAVALLCALSGAARADETNFIQTYVDAHGGCREQGPLLTFEQGAQGRTPFGKPAEEWTEDDLRALKAAMSTCVPRPSGFDLNEEKRVAGKVAAAVEEGRRYRANEERQAEAFREMEQRRAETSARKAHDRLEQQEEQAAISEVRGYFGHIMSAAELDRAKQLKAGHPKLAAWIDGLLAAQERLRQQAAERARDAEERANAARRIEAEQARQALDEQRAEQEAEMEAERKREVFFKALPASCKDAQSADKVIAAGPQHDDFVRASALAEAGDAKSACASFEGFAAKMEAARTSYVQCTKDLDTNLDQLARSEAQRALGRATEIYSQQKALRQKITETACE